MLPVSLFLDDKESGENGFDHFHAILSTKFLINSKDEKHSSLIVNPMESFIVGVAPVSSCKGIMSIISLRYRYSAMGISGQDVRILDCRHEDYPRIVRCFLLNVSNKRLKVSIDDEFLYQWFQAAQYL